VRREGAGERSEWPRGRLVCTNSGLLTAIDVPLVPASFRSLHPAGETGAETTIFQWQPVNIPRLAPTIGYGYGYGYAPLTKNQTRNRQKGVTTSRGNTKAAAAAAAAAAKTSTSIPNPKAVDKMKRKK